MKSYTCISSYAFDSFNSYILAVDPSYVLLERVPWRSPTLLLVGFLFQHFILKRLFLFFLPLNCFTAFLEINWLYSMSLFLLFPFPPIIHTLHTYICSLLSSQLWRLAVQDWVLLSIQPLTP